jgi:hypothetical protein
MKPSFGLFVFSMLFSVSIAWSQEQDYKPVGSGKPEQNTPSETPPEEEPKKKESKEATEQKWNWQNFRLGGSFGLSFGNITYIDISPTAGYFVIPNKLQVGVSTKFIYYNDKFINYNTAIYGGGIYGMYNIWKGVFAQSQFELINKDSYFDINKRVNVPHLLIGGGYMQEVGSLGNIYISALLNVLDTDESIYAPTFGSIPLIIRAGVGFGFPGGRRNR